MKRPLNHTVYDRYYSFLEENNIPVTMHVANPENFWNNSMRLLGEPKRIDYSYMKSLAQSLLRKDGKYSPFADEDLQYILESIDKTTSPKL